MSDSQSPQQILDEIIAEFRKLSELEGNEPIRCSRMHFDEWAELLQDVANGYSEECLPIECNVHQHDSGSVLIEGSSSSPFPVRQDQRLIAGVTVHVPKRLLIVEQLHDAFSSAR